MKTNTTPFRPGMRLMVSLGLLAVLAVPADAAPRLKDIARIDIGGEGQLIGYGLVVGLDGTGDSRSSAFTMRSLANMLTRWGVTVPEERVRVRNTAAVMVVATLSRFDRNGSNIDVTVSSIGDAKSLEGGTLLNTPLATPDGLVYATAQGPVSVGGFAVRGAGSERRSSNYVLAGRVPGGGVVSMEWTPLKENETITILLDDPDYTTATRVVEAVNQEIGEQRAKATDASTIVVEPSAGAEAEDRVTLLARIEGLEVTPDVAARVVVNEKTGTIVAGEKVTIASVAVAHGNLSVEVRARPVISQPAPLSLGETVVTEESQVFVESESTGVVAVEETANVGDLARALNSLGVTPRDIIAILQALKEAGALRAELRII